MFFFIFDYLGNLICILVLTKKKQDLGLKPSFTNLLILLVSKIRYSQVLITRICPMLSNSFNIGATKKRGQEIGKIRSNIWAEFQNWVYLGCGNP